MNLTVLLISMFVIAMFVSITKSDTERDVSQSPTDWAPRLVNSEADGKEQVEFACGSQPEQS
jgi:hypothetical protein